MEEPKLCKVTFVPIGISVDVPAGTMVLDAARQAGVPLLSDCGGDGVCGKCRVIIREGRVEGGSTEFFTREEILQGYVLACQSQVPEPIVVEVPPESTLSSAIVTFDADAEIDYNIAARIKLSPEELAPLVTKHLLELPPPSLGDNTADLERLTTALSKQVDGEFQMGLKAIRSLTETARKSDWKVTATTAYRGALTEIVRVEAGDATARNLGLAVDVGTTTVVVHLVNLRSGETLGAAAKYNSQISLGADVIHRILFAESHGVGKLQQMIVDDINSLTYELMQRNHISRNDITVAAVAGNTTMVHLLLGLEPSYIRREPYVGVGYSPPAFRAAEVGLHIAPRGLLYCLPMISSFVGADSIAGVLAVGMDTSDDLSVMIDVGTNGEIVIGNRDWLVCASASAGPAFEGAQTRDGMRAQAGAIDHVKILDKDRLLSFSTVASAPPRGICGTGYIDLLAELLRVGLIDRTGTLNLECGSGRIRCAGEPGTDPDPSESEYVVIRKEESGSGKDVVITQADIRSMLLAKAAIYAAARVLLKSLELTFADVDHLHVAGAFGHYLVPQSAILIGLLPDVPTEKIRFVGNSSVAGAKLTLLSKDNYRHAQELARKMTYFELSTAPGFMDEFVSAQFFPHTDVELFPTAAAVLGGQSA